ncbi:hypothetical protein OSB04_019165 [Centaurea solstitialis]|uniref:Integrase catalytic domain-containing protein n=1 Tax=Centaurea solstitialis TaxID=347529 RepID=A0AA38W2L3_9ASTR|nr:hypothetical protein OSB04_019165 [Centaurea solstitialis]
MHNINPVAIWRSRSSKSGAAKFDKDEDQVKPIEKELSSIAREFIPRHLSEASEKSVTSNDVESLCEENLPGESSNVQTFEFSQSHKDLLSSNSEEESVSYSEVVSCSKKHSLNDKSVNQASELDPISDSKSVSSQVIEFEIVAQPFDDGELVNHPMKTIALRRKSGGFPISCNTAFRECFNIMHALSNHFHYSSCLVMNHRGTSSRDNKGHFGNSDPLKKETTCVYLHNLISVSQLCDNGMDVMFKIKYCIMYKVDTLTEVMRANKRGDLYLMCFETLEAKEEICLVSSVKNEEHASGTPDAACGPIAKRSLNGKKYILVLVDEFSRYTWVEFVRKKSHVPMLLINLLKRLQVLQGLQVRVIRSDLGVPILLELENLIKNSFIYLQAIILYIINPINYILAFI